MTISTIAMTMTMTITFTMTMMITRYPGCQCYWSLRSANWILPPTLSGLSASLFVSWQVGLLLLYIHCLLFSSFNIFIACITFITQKTPQVEQQQWIMNITSKWKWKCFQCLSQTLPPTLRQRMFLFQYWRILRSPCASTPYTWLSLQVLFSRDNNNNKIVLKYKM